MEKKPEQFEESSTQVRRGMIKKRAKDVDTDPDNGNYVSTQTDMIDKMRELHLLPDDPSEAVKAFIQKGDAEYFSECVRSRKKVAFLRKILKKLITNGMKLMRTS